jgi:hypothetical protein
MKLFTLIAVIVCFIFGVAMILVPYQTVSLYGTHLDVSGQFMARYLGSALLGLAAILYLGRSAKTIESSVKGGLFGLFVFGITGLIVSIWDVFAGTHNALVWLNVVIYTFFSVGFGYYYLKR